MDNAQQFNEKKRKRSNDDEEQKMKWTKIHEGKKQFECFICDYKYSEKKYLTSHIASVHEGKKPFKCLICDHKCLEKGNFDSAWVHD